VEYYTILLEELLQVAGGGNLFLTVVSKTDQNGSMMLKSGDCTSQGR
jgi:hypothetical protein